MSPDTVPSPAQDETDATEKYLAAPLSARHGLALGLSGGGFRAALFYLGALRPLAEALGESDERRFPLDTW
jgi:hypothetical protein